MIVAALVMMALGSSRHGSATLSGQVVDAEGRPAAGVEVLLSGLGRGLRGRPVLSRAKSDQDGRFRIDVPAEKDPRRANFSWRSGPTPRRRGSPGRRSRGTALPAAGSVQLKLGGPVHTAVRVVGPDGKPVAGARVAPVWVRVAGGIRPRSTFPPPDSLADVLAATTDADGKGQIQGCRAEDIEAVLGRSRRVRSPGKRARRGCRRRPGDHAEARRPADRPRSGRRSIRGAGVGGHRHDTAAGIGRPAIVGRGPRDDRCRRPLRDPGPRRRQARAQRASRRRLEAATQASHRPHDRARQDHRGHDPDGGPPARADGGGPGGRPQRPARRRRHRVPVRRFLGANRSRDRRGWAIRIERGRRAADVPVRPEAGLPLRRPRHRGRVRRRDARDPQGRRAAPARAENASAPVAPPGRNRPGAPPARPLRGARSQTGGRAGEGAHARSTRAHRARARARADPAEEGVHCPVFQRHDRPASGHAA